MIAQPLQVKACIEIPKDVPYKAILIEKNLCLYVIFERQVSQKKMRYEININNDESQRKITLSEPLFTYLAVCSL